MSWFFRSHEPTTETADVLTLDPKLPIGELIDRLRINALRAHQVSVGRGDALIQILRRTIQQMERSHSRIQAMSVTLFIVGIVLAGFGVYAGVFNDPQNNVVSVVFGATGAVAALVATFWTAPVEKISDSITDLVKLETAFLGYIRLVGEVDSAFQMQYLALLARGDESGIRLDQLTQDTTRLVTDAMKETVELIDRFVASNGALGDVETKVSELEKHVTALKGSA
jgi:hypothetical protein